VKLAILFVISGLLLPGCTPFGEEVGVTPDCATNDECSTRLSAPGVCVQDPVGHCVQLTSEDCSVVTGDYRDDRAVLIASLLSTTGAQSATNLPRQQAAIMAVEEINASNASGGILQSLTPGDTRKLVMVSCDEVADLPRVATHLVTDLKVTAIVGPNLSQDVIDLTIGNPAIGLPSSAQAGTALVTPTGVASAIATIPDNGLTYMMVPSDIQRVPLMKLQINQLEDQLRAERGGAGREIKLGIYYRGDALGEGTRDGLSSLMLNGGTLASALVRGKARQDAYDPAATNHTAQVTAYLSFQPDIIVMVGAAEAVKYFIVPLEAAWPTGLGAPPRPYYIAIDSTKVPDLITAVTNSSDLRLRFRGTGLATIPETAPVLNAFQLAFGQRWKDASGKPAAATTSGMGSTYDAVYTIALALVGKTDVRGASLASGLSSLATNAEPCVYDASGVKSPCFTVTDHVRTLYDNMGTLVQGKPVTEIGTSGRLEWDPQGAKASGVIEMWCINGVDPTPSFESGKLSYDVKSQTPTGDYVQCPPRPGP
jgi:ABC-type branched-subunit amino acid transport system substrate-binding protein